MAAAVEKAQRKLTAELLRRTHLTHTAAKFSSKSPKKQVLRHFGRHKITSLFALGTFRKTPRPRLPPSPQKSKNTEKFANLSKQHWLPIHFTTFLAQLKIIIIYLGEGEKIVRLGTNFKRHRLLQIRKKLHNFLFRIVYLRCRHCCRFNLTRSSNIFFREWAKLIAIEI